MLDMFGKVRLVDSGNIYKLLRSCQIVEKHIKSLIEQNSR